MVNQLGDVLGKDKQRLDGTVEQLGTIDTSTYFEVPQDIVLANIADIRVDSTSIAGSTLIWGNSTFGTWGSFNWGNTQETGFRLGNSVSGILGTNRLGIDESNPQRVVESAIFYDLSDSFETTVNQDSANSTVFGWGTGSLEFSGEQQKDFNNGSFTNNVLVSSGSIVLD